MPRSWEIHIPVRPKAVQSSRGDRGHFHVDPAVRKWKEKIRPYILAACNGPASRLPIRGKLFRYTYRLPKSAPKRVFDYVKAGGIIPYLAPADLTDNLSKGVVDVCKGLVFEDDSQIWEMERVRKIYGIEDRIDLVFEETPDVVLVTGKPACGETDNTLW